MKRLIQGAGGGGKSGGGSTHVPSESADSLQSRSRAKVIDLVSEGEIEGLVDGLKSIYLDETPLQAADGSYNFKGVSVDTRNGTQSQEYLMGFSATESETQVGVEVKETPIVRTITNELIDAVRVRISMPQMTYQDPSTGDLTGTEVSYKIELQSGGAGYVEVLTDTVIGKSVSKYERSYRVDLTGPGPWDIRVTRLTAVPTSVTTQNRTIWESYTEIVDGKLRYPNSAVVAIDIDASQFTSIPTRGYDMKLLRIRVPSNYNPTTRAYSGAWDGTFQIAWSDNPAWVFYDLMTSARYGLGSFIPEEQVDKWALYTIAKYCDELVPDGEGGFEPRFTCNAYLQTRAEAFKVLQDLASVFRGMVYWANGTITVTQDSPTDPVYLFTQANVVDGLFTYSGSSSKTRHTVAQVTWNDPEDFYRQKVEYVEDAEGVAKFGLIEAQVTAFGCTSRGQAARVGKWLLYSEQYQTEVVSFKAGLEGSGLRPGEVIKIADPVRSGLRLGGRIKSVSSVNVEIDQPLTIDPATHTFSALLPTGVVEERSIVTALGTSVVLSSTFSQDPQPGSVWLVSSTDVEAQLFKVIGIREAAGGVYEINAIAHDPSKFDYIEEDLKLEPRSISALSEVPDKPKGLAITETLYAVNADVRVKVTVSWNAVVGASSYVVQYQRDNANIQTMPATQSNDVEILNAEPGTYTVSVYAVNPLGVRSTATTGSKKIIGKALPPGDVEGFSLMPLSGYAFLSWEKSTDLDVLVGGSVRIRHTPELVAPEWKNSVDITRALAGSATRAQVPLIAGTYLAKFVDSSGNASVNAAAIVTSVPEHYSINVVETVTESPGFAGARDKMEFFADLGGLGIAAKYTIDEVLEDIDDVGSFDFAGGVAEVATYDFENPVDLGEVFSSRVTAAIEAIAIDSADTIDIRTDLADDWADLDGSFIDDVNVELQMQTTEDDPASPSAEWTEWKRFVVGEYKARAFKFRLYATSAGNSHTMVVTSLGVTIDMPDRTENLRGLISGAGLYSVSFGAPFHETPAVGVSASDMNSGDYFVITNKTRFGFDITFKNSSGVAVSRTFDVLAKGYGRQSA